MTLNDQFLSQLLDTYVQLRPSNTSGIGVFAIRDIPKGCRTIFTRDNGEWRRVPISDVDKLPTYLIDLIRNYCVSDDRDYFIEAHGFKKMDLANFLNHSDSPNIIPINDGEFFEAAVDIKCGEELFINYAEVHFDS